MTSGFSLFNLKWDCNYYSLSFMVGCGHVASPGQGVVTGGLTCIPSALFSIHVVTYNIQGCGYSSSRQRYMTRAHNYFMGDRWHNHKISPCCFKSLRLWDHLLMGHKVAYPDSDSNKTSHWIFLKCRFQLNH